MEDLLDSSCMETCTLMFTAHSKVFLKCTSCCVVIFCIAHTLGLWHPNSHMHSNALYTRCLSAKMVLTGNGSLLSIVVLKISQGTRFSNEYSKTPLLRPPLGLRNNGLYSAVVLILR